MVYAYTDWICMLLIYLCVIESLLPRFAEPIQNVTVTVGRDALLACVVDNLRGYKVTTYNLI